MLEQDILDMQYDLARDRSIAVDDNLASMSLLYFYSKYKKEREAAQQQQALQKSQSSRRR